MSEPHKAPAKTPEPTLYEHMSPFERLKEFTRRLMAVPKSELTEDTTKRKGV